MLRAYVFNLIYGLVILLASPWLGYQAWRHGKYREGFAAKLLGRVFPNSTIPTDSIWLHAVSVGEVNLIAPLVTQLRSQHPQQPLVISATTKAGFHLAQKKYADCQVIYAPLDFSWAVKAALVRIRPKLLILAELELWPNLIEIAHAQGVKIAVINGRLSQKSFRGYRKIKPLVTRILGQLDLIAVQNQEYAERFLALGAATDRVQITGSLKFDNITTDRQNLATQNLARLIGLTSETPVFLAGSTQQPEEIYALETFRELQSEFPNLRLILVPRHPERFEAVAQLLKQSGLPWQRRTELVGQNAPEDNPTSPIPPILLVDTIGELSAWWGTATVAFVGGSMGSRGGQNMIEPAAYGAAVCFGTNTRNFRDIVAALLQAEAAQVVATPNDLTAFVRRCLKDRVFAQHLGQNAQQLVKSQHGATHKTMQHLEALLQSNAPGSGSATRSIPTSTSVNASSTEPVSKSDSARQGSVLQHRAA